MFLEPTQYSWVREFRAAFPQIKQELEEIIDQPMAELYKNTWAGERPNYLETLSEPTTAWKTLTFRFFGIDHLPNCKSCPTIERLISKRPDLVTVEFSMLEPHTHILPHRGFTGLVYRGHLGMKIPAGEIGLRVADETRRWEEGGFLVFDDSIEHEAWNKTDERRVVLMVDFVPPDAKLSPLDICQKVLKETTDSHILGLAPRESWLRWLAKGSFPLQPE